MLSSIPHPSLMIPVINTWHLCTDLDILEAAFYKIAVNSCSRITSLNKINPSLLSLLLLSGTCMMAAEGMRTFVVDICITRATILRDGTIKGNNSMAHYLENTPKVSLTP